MEVKDDYRKRKTKDKPGSENSKHENISRSLGDVSSAGSTDGINQRGTTRENSYESIAATDCGHEISGGVVVGLIQDAETELAFYKEQVKKIERRIQRLNDLHKSNS